MTTAVELLTTAQAAEFIGIHPGTLNRWQATGLERIPSKIAESGNRVYKAADLERWINSKAAAKADARRVKYARVQPKPKKKRAKAKAVNG